MINKYSGINLLKDSQVLYTENYNVMLQGIREGHELEDPKVLRFPFPLNLSVDSIQSQL